MTRAIQSEMPKLFKMIILIYFVYFAGLDSPNSAVFLSSCRVAISSSQLQVSLGRVGSTAENAASISF
jgi:hypothetical protein